MICKVVFKWTNVKDDGYFCNFEILKEYEKLGSTGVHVSSNEFEIRKRFVENGENKWQDADFQTIYVFDYDKYKTYEWYIVYDDKRERLYKYVDIQLRMNKLERLCQETQNT